MSATDKPRVELTVQNYRCFPDTKPLRFEVARGFTSFVGINNAGKSSILRLFWELQQYLSFLATPSVHHVNALNGQLQQYASHRALPGEQVFSKLNERDLQLTFSWSKPRIASGNNAVAAHEVTILVPRVTNGLLLRATLDGDLIQGDIGFSGDTLTVSNVPQMDWHPFLDACRFLGSAMYIGPFRNAINVGASERYFDIAVGQQFAHEFHDFKAGANPTANEAMYRLIHDIKRIFAFDEFDINASADMKTLQVFIDGRSFRLGELGAGVAQFIVVLANVLVRQPSLVLVDEPETSLHPTLQLDFLTTLASYAREASIFFATHNLGLARAASDRIYSCRRVELGVSEVRPLEATPHLAEFLGELGFSAYRDLGFDSVLLVEGPSDVKAMQQFLRLWRKDHKVVLLPLGGSSMINEKAAAEMAEIARIAPNVAVIIDSERTQPDEALAKGREGFVAVCENLGVQVLVLERRATENYLTDAAVKKALGGDQYRALGPYEALKDVEPGWSKRDNWRITREMGEDDLKGTDLGDFLAKL